MNNYKIVSVANGTNASDAVNKGQLDAAIANVSGGSIATTNGYSIVTSVNDI